MADDINNFSTISSLIDDLLVVQATNSNDETTGAQNELLSQLYTQLSAFDDHSLTLDTLEKLEECFIQLNRLASEPSPSPLLTGLCLMILKKLTATNFLFRNMGQNKSKYDKYYTLAMEALSTKENLDYLQDNNQNSTPDLYKLYSNLYLRMARETIRCRNRALELLTVQEWNLRTLRLEDKYKLFLKILLSFIDKKLNTTEDVSGEIVFLVILSDDINLIPDLVQCELPQHLKIWLLTYINKKNLEDDNLCALILVIINNVARHEEGSDALKNLRMSDVLQDFWKKCQNKLPKDVLTIYYMAYALIITPEQLKSAIILHDVIDYLIQNINIASCSPDMRNDIGHISEYLVALARLVVNDNVAQYIINTWKMNATLDGLTFFNKLFQKYNDLTSNDLYLKHLSRIALFNIFCSFSFQATAQKCLAVDKKFVEIIKNAARPNNEQDVIHSYLLQHLLSVKQAAEAILINLDLYKDEDAVKVTESSKTTHPSVMISYSHKDRTFCRNLVQALKSNSVDIWVDEDGHCRSDDCWEEIAVAIKYASFILVIVSPHYCESVSCRKEATYADKRKKPLIAVYPEGDKYEPDEWLDIRLTGLYVRFSENGKKSFDTCISHLLEYIRPKQDEIINSLIPQPISSSLPTKISKPSDNVPVIETQSREIALPKASQFTNITKSSIHEWTKDDVQTWFLVERQLLPQLYKLYSFVDGDSLLEYAKHFIQEYDQDSKQQYEKLNKRLRKEFDIELYDNNYTDLVSSMKKLLLTYDQQSLPTNKIKKPRSAFCLIL